MEQKEHPLIKNLPSSNLNQIFIAILVFSVLLGLGTGFVLAGTNKTPTTTTDTATTKTASVASQDNRTFRDFAQGKLVVRTQGTNSNEYAEGTHLLIRDGGTPVALTSSVVDLSEYENKKVKVFGETQKALKEGWLMDVGKVEVLN